MKKLKATIAICFTFIIAAAATAESYQIDEFKAFGIESIGIYTEGYEDERVKDFEAEYMEAYMMQNVYTFRYTLCDFETVTPKLTSPGYPLKGSSGATDLDAVVGEELEWALGAQEWNAELIDDFAGGSLAELLSTAKADGKDAVMVLRYYTIDYYVPFSGYSSVSGYSTITVSARVGELIKGKGLLPAAELYDTATGERLWYSAYYTGHIDGTDSLAYQQSVDNAAEFFVTDDETGAEAAKLMVSLTLGSGDMPDTSASAARDESKIAPGDNSTHMFWTDYPEYDFFGTLIGIGYNFSYVGDFNLYYRDDDAPWVPYDEQTYDLVGTAPNTLMHTMTMPVFTFAAKNISFDPAFYFGFMQPASTSITYTDYVRDENDYYADLIPVSKTEDISVWGMSVGMDLSLKYYLRFTDTLSAFIGGRGLAEAWILFINSDNEDLDSYDFSNEVGGLASVDFFTFNASLLAGVRFDTESPVELFAMLTPVGPGGGMMISAGINWYGATYEWVSPHAKNVAPMMRW